MKPTIRIRALSTLAAAVVPLLAATAAPAWASAIPNDDISSATVITSLPVHDVVDMSQATWDPSTDDSSCNFYNHAQSVWYQFTPAASEQVEFDPSASNQPMIIDVYTGTPRRAELRRLRQWWRRRPGQSRGLSPQRGRWHDLLDHGVADLLHPEPEPGPVDIPGCCPAGHTGLDQRHRR